MEKSYSQDLERRTALGITLVARQVVHDVRSPLSAIRMALDSLSGYSDRKAAAALQVVRTATDRIVGMTDELSSRAGIGIGESMTGSLEKFDVGGVLESIVAEKQAEFGIVGFLRIHKGIEGAHIYGHELAFRRVLSNLINNAIEAAHDGKPQIDLQLIVGVARISVVVKDRGSGIAAGSLSKLRAGEIISTKGSSGIGLSSARMFAAQVGGNLEINSHIGIGTEVVMHIPKLDT